MQHPSRPVENGSVFGDVTKASSSSGSNLNPVQLTHANEDVISRKRKADMRCLNEVVTLLVGDDPESKDSRFVVHKDILCAASPFFEAACKQERQSTEKDIILLPEDEPEVIRAFVNWVYFNSNIYLSEKDSATKTPIDRPDGILVKLYVLGDKYQMPRLRNQAVDALSSYFEGNHGYDLEVLDYACKNTAKHSALRNFLAINAIGNLCNGELYDLDEKMYPELIHDMAIQLMKDRDENLYFKPLNEKKIAPKSFCEKYHTHEANYNRVECERLSQHFDRRKSYMLYGYN
ncbi:hypothetical protein NHQ30_000966 [Ciborinia camelliae]|nr:hypothetical protein NHQ30_000966 [Ciborinia camelliae]